MKKCALIIGRPVEGLPRSSVARIIDSSDMILAQGYKTVYAQRS